MIIAGRRMVLRIPGGLDNSHAILDWGSGSKEVGVRGIDNSVNGVYGLLNWNEQPTSWIRSKNNCLNSQGRLSNTIC